MPETIKVRIALVINGEGRWNSAGWSGGMTAADLMGVAVDGMPDEGVEARYWVEVDVPVPVPGGPASVAGRLVAEGAGTARPEQRGGRDGADR